LTRRGACPWDSYLIPDEFLKYGLGGDGGESKRSATNLPLGSDESNQVYRMV